MHVLQYPLDDVFAFYQPDIPCARRGEIYGRLCIFKAFIDHISERESENFRSRKRDNKDALTLTTALQVFLCSDFFTFFVFLFLCSQKACTEIPFS